MVGQSRMFVSTGILRWEKRSDVHTEDRRIRKEVSPRTKASSTKASLSEKLSKIERLHQPDASFVCIPNTTKSDTISIYLYIVYISVSPLCFNKISIVKGEFFLSLSCQHPGNLFQWNTLTVRRSSWLIESSPICGSFKLNVGIAGVDKPTNRKRIWYSWN